MMFLRVVVRPHLSSSTLYLSTKSLPSLTTTIPSRRRVASFPSYSIRSLTTFQEKEKEMIEHVVLFKVKEDTDPSNINSMINGLNGLISLDQVLHLSAGPILRNRSSSFNFTHILHSRYQSKEDLSAYSAHPSHLTVVKESVLPICDDIMAVDWVSSTTDLEEVVVPSGSAMRVQFLKLKEEGEKGEILGVIKGVKDSFGSLIDQISFGENFSPARAKGFSVASIAVFRGLNELYALDSKEEQEKVKEEKDKVRDSLESVIIVDYVVPSPPSANL